jgi:DNA-binding NtrC family response regulator
MDPPWETPVTDILVVDSDEEWFDKCEKAVSGMGFGVRWASSRHHAFAAIRECPPDLVFVGLKSASEDREILWLLDDLLPEVPVVVCSAEGDLSGGHAAFFHDSTAAFLHKFADPTEIVGTMARVLVRSRGVFDNGDSLGSTVH